MEIFDINQIIILNQMIKMLDLDIDQDIDLNKNNIKEKFIAPYNITNNKNWRIERCLVNMELEEECQFGINCPNKKIPFLCPKNHQGLNKIYYTNSIIPNLICKYERPWRILNNKSMRCQNKNCWFSHLKGRVDFINQLKNTLS